MKLDPGLNPFAPGYGRPPPTLAGRKKVQEAFAAEIAKLAAKKSADRAMLLIGPRGCGKTVLLETFRNLAARSNLDVFLTERGNLPNDSTGLAKLIRGQPTKRTRTTTVERGIHRVLKAGASHSVSDEPWEPPAADLLDALIERASEKPLILLLDETHDIPPVILRDLFKASQAAALDQHPVMLVSAGTPETKAHLLASGVTFVERIPTHAIGRLDDDSAVRAITGPFEDAGVSIGPETAARAARAAQNYPYFLQSVGQALWNSAAESDAESVDDDVLKQSYPEASRSMRLLYNERAGHMRQRGMLAGAAELVLSSPGDAPKSSAIRAFIASIAVRQATSGFVPPAYPADAESPLTAKQLQVRHAEKQVLHSGFVWNPSSDQWEYGIPSLAAHVTEAAAERIRELADLHDAAPVLQALIEDGKRFAASLDALMKFAAQALDGQDASAQSFVNDMLDIGVIGPSDSRDSDGNPHYRLLTPQIAAAALKRPGPAAA